jgi:SAM-dependent methyltransferase
LDVGGGIGRFASLLAQAGGHQVDVLDCSAVAASSFIACPGVRLISADYLEWVAPPDDRYDLVIFRVVLHHLLGPTSAATARTQQAALLKAAQLLRPAGQVYVFENIYDPLVGEDLTATLIHGVTRLKSLASVTRRLGANTAGEGVHFHSLSAWRRIAQGAGLTLQEEYCDHTWAQDSFPLWQRLPLACARRYHSRGPDCR